MNMSIEKKPSSIIYVYFLLLFSFSSHPATAGFPAGVSSLNKNTAIQFTETLSISSSTGIHLLSAFTHVADTSFAIAVAKGPDFTAQGGGEVILRPDRFHPTFSHWDDAGHWLEWAIEIPGEGLYLPEFLYSTNHGPVLRNLSVDGELHQPELIFSNTGGWGQEKEHWEVMGIQQGIDLSPGTRTIRMENISGGGLNLAWIAWYQPMGMLERNIEVIQQIADDSASGTEPGEYPQEAMDALQQALTYARSVLNDAQASDREVIDAIGVLAQSLHQFINSVNLPADLVLLKNRIREELLEPSVNESTISHLGNTLQQDGSWADIDYDNVSRTGWEHRTHLSRLETMSRAFSKQNSPLYRDEDMKAALHSALDFWLANDFISDNWYHNEISTPRSMARIFLMLDDDLKTQQIPAGQAIIDRANLDAFGARPGGDLIIIAGIMGKSAIFQADEPLMETAAAAMAGEIRVADGNPDYRGLQTDMSFQHRTDGVISTLAYGRNYPASFAPWAIRLLETRYAFPEQASQLLIDFYLDGISKSMIHGIYRDPGASNRELSRPGTLNPVSSSIPEMLSRISSHRQDEMETLIRVRSGIQPPDYSFNSHFWRSHYHGHQRPGYFTSVRTHSSKNHNVEQPYNSEGLMNHFLGDGANFISRTGTEYFRIFPYWDWRKVPGTTVVQIPSMPPSTLIQRRGRSSFVGGVSNGRYGANGFDFVGSDLTTPQSRITARKAWFFFDDEYVALGTGISSNAPFPVATTLNQCHLTGEVQAGTPEGVLIPSQGSHDLANVKWVHHDEIGYFFPEPESVQMSNTISTGNWWRINQQAWSSTDEVLGQVFTLWLDHGPNPEESGYAYIVVPNLSAGEAAGYWDHTPVHILANNPSMQAVQHAGLNITQIMFYEPGVLEIADGISLSIDIPGMVMARTEGEKVVELVVSSPLESYKSMNLKVTARVEGDHAIWEESWNDSKGYSDLYFDLPGGAWLGKTVTEPAEIPQGSTAEDAGPEVSGSLYLGQNYPNPFNPQTTITYRLPDRGLVRLDVFDVTGRLVTAVVNEIVEAGTHHVSFDASGLASGIYLYRLWSGQETLVRRMVVVK